MKRTQWTIHKSAASKLSALKLTRGSYQAGLIRGWENLSGSTLKGAARKYGARYMRSRIALLSRLKSAGIPVSEEVAEHGARILVIG